MAVNLLDNNDRKKKNQANIKSVGTISHTEIIKIHQNFIWIHPQLYNRLLAIPALDCNLFLIFKKKNLHNILEYS